MKQIIEQCPVCTCPHEKGKYKTEHFMCRCGHVLRWSLPLIKLSDSGYNLKVVGPKEFNSGREA